MKRQTIYPMLVVVFATVLVTSTHAQIRQRVVSEMHSQRLLSDTLNKAQPRAVGPARELPANSPKGLRALIFENHAPSGSKSVGLRSAATPQLLRKAGAAKLPSDSPAEEITGPEQAPVQALPTQGDAKEQQQ